MALLNSLGHKELSPGQETLPAQGKHLGQDWPYDRMPALARGGILDLSSAASRSRWSLCIAQRPVLHLPLGVIFVPAHPCSGSMREVANFLGQVSTRLTLPLKQRCKSMLDD